LSSLPAAPGHYRARLTGIEIKDPDFVALWTVNDARRDLIPSHLKHGFADYIPQEDVQPGGAANPHPPSAQVPDGR